MHLLPTRAAERAARHAHQLAAHALVGAREADRLHQRIELRPQVGLDRRRAPLRKGRGGRRRSHRRAREGERGVGGAREALAQEARAQARVEATLARPHADGGALAQLEAARGGEEGVEGHVVRGGRHQLGDGGAAAGCLQRVERVFEAGEAGAGRGEGGGAAAEGGVVGLARRAHVVEELDRLGRAYLVRAHGLGAALRERVTPRARPRQAAQLVARRQPPTEGDAHVELVAARAPDLRVVRDLPVGEPLEGKRLLLASAAEGGAVLVQAAKQLRLRPRRPAAAGHWRRRVVAAARDDRRRAHLEVGLALAHQRQVGRGEVGERHGHLLKLRAARSALDLHLVLAQALQHDAAAARARVARQGRGAEAR
mmetsp:Transcript_8327/g.21948  ORF Transcript_8327/g.21948 Transcript_8327/m.21948 type:complete len:370 (+) Transcript_8327:579-1688(+)